MSDEGSLVVADCVTAVRRSGLKESQTVASNLDKGKMVGSCSTGIPADGGEAVANLMRKLNLTAKEADPLILDDEGDEDPPCPEWALVGKVLAPNTLHVNTIKAVVRPAWGNPKGLVVRSLGPNLFLAEFSSELDKNRVAKGGPWCLSKHAILLKDFDVKVQPEDIVFDKLMVWARLMNLGYELMNDVRGSTLASRLGEVDHVEVDENGRAWGSYLRARVNIDPTQPNMRYASAYSKKEIQLFTTRLCMKSFLCSVSHVGSLVTLLWCAQGRQTETPKANFHTMVTNSAFQRGKRETLVPLVSRAGTLGTAQFKGRGTKAKLPWERGKKVHRVLLRPQHTTILMHEKLRVTVRQTRLLWRIMSPSHIWFRKMSV
jgi:hypothetical protein